MNDGNKLAALKIYNDKEQRQLKIKKNKEVETQQKETMKMEVHKMTLSYKEILARL